MTDCNNCGEETTFWKRCRPRLTRKSGYVKKLQAVWYRCTHCGHPQFTDRAVAL